MNRTAKRIARWLPLCFFLAVSAGFTGDVIDLSNARTKEVGALVDGSRDGSFVNDASYLRLDLGGFFDAVFPVIPLDDFTFDATHNEIIAFAHRRPPILVPGAPWSVGDDRIDVAFHDEYRIPLQIWIVYGPFDAQRLRAANSSLTTATTWAKERAGVAFSEVVITDATQDPETEGFHAFHCSEAAAMKEEIGHVPGRVNVYYVSTVDFGTGPGAGNGVWCASNNIIAMGRNSSGMLLAHEIGHSFNLAHPLGGVIGVHFDSTNVMIHSSSNREFLTEGQNFRATYHQGSALNDIYDVRQGQLVRTCPHHYEEDNADCPPIQKRIWADGENWPPN